MVDQVDHRYAAGQPYRFLSSTGHENRILFKKQGTSIRRLSPTPTGSKLVHLNRDLVVEMPLRLRIESLSPCNPLTNSNNLSFVLGITACTPSVVLSDPGHYEEICAPMTQRRRLTSCYGICMPFKITYANMGSIVTIRRDEGTVFHVTVEGSGHHFEVDLKDRFKGIKSYLFVWLNGNVSGLTILTKPVIQTILPVPRPMPCQTSGVIRCAPAATTTTTCKIPIRPQPPQQQQPTTTSATMTARNMIQKGERVLQMEVPKSTFTAMKDLLMAGKHPDSLLQHVPYIRKLFAPTGTPAVTSAALAAAVPAKRSEETVNKKHKEKEEEDDNDTESCDESENLSSSGSDMDLGTENEEGSSSSSSQSSSDEEEEATKGPVTKTQQAQVMKPQECRYAGCDRVFMSSISLSYHVANCHGAPPPNLHVKAPLLRDLLKSPATGCHPEMKKSNFRISKLPPPRPTILTNLRGKVHFKPIPPTRGVPNLTTPKPIAPIPSPVVNRLTPIIPRTRPLILRNSKSHQQSPLLIDLEKESSSPTSVKAIERKGRDKSSVNRPAGNASCDRKKKKKAESQLPPDNMECGESMALAKRGPPFCNQVKSGGSKIEIRSKLVGQPAINKTKTINDTENVNPNVKGIGISTDQVTNAKPSSNVQINQILAQCKAPIATQLSHPSPKEESIIVPIRRTWYSSECVKYNGSIICRHKISKPYIFGDEMKFRDEIAFSFKELVFSKGSIGFGVTKTSPDQIDFARLPDDVTLLQKYRSQNDWAVVTNLVPDSGNLRGKEIRLKRTATGISLLIDGLEEKLFLIFHNVRIYPFFHFDGAVSSILIKD